MAFPPLAPGMRIHDRYVLRQRIGAGGMGEVWNAHDTRLDRPVAIKLIPGASEPQIRQEARAAGRLTHPHIAGIYDFGDTGPGGYGYLAMELLSGQTLADRMMSGPLSWPETARITGQVAGALAAAHERGIVHRDIKPANIMLTAGGVKVLDFGIATAAYANGDTAAIAGTPGYTAPERLRGGASQDPAADVYSLAVVVYEALTGTLPRPINTWSDLANADFNSPVTMPPAIPAEVARLLEAALSPDARQRPSAAALERLLTLPGASPATVVGRRLDTPATPPTLITTAHAAGVASVPRPRPAPTSVAEPVVLGPGRSPARVALLAIVIVAAVLAAVIGLTSLSHSGTSHTAASIATNSAGPTNLPSESPSSPGSQVDSLLITLQQTIDAADANGSLNHDQAKSLSKTVQKIQSAWASGDLNEFRDQVQHLRDNLNNSDHHGGDHGNDQGGSTDTAVAQAINSTIDQLLAAAGVGQ